MQLLKLLSEGDVYTPETCHGEYCINLGPWVVRLRSSFPTFGWEAGLLINIWFINLVYMNCQAPYDLIQPDPVSLGGRSGRLG